MRDNNVTNIFFKNRKYIAHYLISKYLRTMSQIDSKKSFIWILSSYATFPAFQGIICLVMKCALLSWAPLQVSNHLFVIPPFSVGVTFSSWIPFRPRTKSISFLIVPQREALQDGRNISHISPFSSGGAVSPREIAINLAEMIFFESSTSPKWWWMASNWKCALKLSRIMLSRSGESLDCDV